MNTSTEMQSHS